MACDTTSNIYTIYYDDVVTQHNGINMNNRLFLTFVLKDELDSFINDLPFTYSILYNKAFVFDIGSETEYVVSYNVDQHNISSVLPNTILVHRKKQSNSLYTINALNELIKSLNGGKHDSRFNINWQDYKNTILLTREGELVMLKTKIHDIVNF